MQTRIVDLEATLSQTRAEVARLKREKEEVTYIHFDFIVYSFCDGQCFFRKSHSINTGLLQNYFVENFVYVSFVSMFIKGIKVPLPPAEKRS